jgi:chemotaxis protein MotB
MSALDPEDRKREIIIVRRRNDDDEHPHHGGVWKIAFADFMTALMCFFLVMWLVNASNEQTKAAIASYFNPMTLVDSAPSSKGLSDPGETQSEDSTDTKSSTPADAETQTKHDQAGPGKFANSLDHADSEQTSDQHLFSDPYAVLAEIAAQTAMLQNVSEKGDGGAQSSGPATGAQGGESYRDPFAPDFWSQEVANPDDEADLDVFRKPQPDLLPEEEEELAELVEGEEPVAFPAAAAPVQAEESASEAVVNKAEQIREDIMQAFGRDSALNRTISVTATAGGIQISLTDELNYGMFEVGSAVPQGQLVRAMETIGRTLNEHTGRISINGHTDGRPFRNANYDNWRLSSARAHSAYYMLVRGGVDETRVKEVAGFADRELKIPSDPYAHANRRIEIFMEVEE